jgi:6-phosphogluconolactonase
MGIKPLCYPDAATLAKAAAGDWLRALEIAFKNPRNDLPYSVALSGGRVAKDFFGEIVRQAQAKLEVYESLLRRVHYFWADERCVPPTDPESNYKAARELLFEPLNIAEAQIHRLRGEAEEATVLNEATESICKQAPPEKGKGQPVLDVIFLGMGEDGHVASLFPGEPAEVTTSPAIYRLVTAVKPPPRRITLGYGVLAAAKEVWVLASGGGKEQALKESLSPQGKTPLARVLRSRAGKETKVYTDAMIKG